MTSLLHPDITRLGIPMRALNVHQVIAPSDQMIKATCQEVGCLNYRHGWLMMFDERIEKGRAGAGLIRGRRHGRTFQEQSAATAEGLTVFRFDAWQRCFANHRTRKELFVVQSGLGSPRLHSRPLDWAEHMNETLDRSYTSRARG